MPFTLCHPAVVLPLSRYTARITSLPALVIGSMSPDFVYFLSLGISRTFTHTPMGVALYCVPAGLVAYLLYHALIREPALVWLPGEIAARFRSPMHWPLQGKGSVACVLGSLAIGAASHIAWDSFTHANTAVVNRYEIFQKLIPLGGYKLPLFKILQQLSNLVGFFVMTWCAVAWFKHAAPLGKVKTSLSRARKMQVLAIVTLAALMGGVAGLLLPHPKSVEHGLFNFVVSGMAGAALSIMCLCCAWHASMKRNAVDG